MSNALELNSLFRKYAGTLADIDSSEADATRSFNAGNRDMRISRDNSKKSLSNKMAGQGIANSGISLGENVKLNQAYTNAGVDAKGAYDSQMSTLARKRLEAKNIHDESVALSTMTNLLNQG